MRSWKTLLLLALDPFDAGTRVALVDDWSVADDSANDFVGGLNQFWMWNRAWRISQVLH